jgi:hypothetical protein
MQSRLSHAKLDFDVRRGQIVCLVRQPSRLRLPFSLRAAARARLKLIVGSLADVHLYEQVAGLINDFPIHSFHLRLD